MSGQLHTYKLLCVGSTLVLLINIDSFHCSLCVCVFYSIDYNGGPVSDMCT